MRSSLLAAPEHRELAAPAPIVAPAVAANPSVAVSEIWQILWHRRRLVLATTAVVTAAALLYCLLTPTLFTATAQILADPRDLQVVSNDVNPTTVAPDGGVTQVESQASVVQSNSVLLRAIAATDLTNDPEFNRSGFLDRIIDSVGLGAETGAGGPDGLKARTLDALRRRLSVKRADKVLVVDVSVTAKSAEKAAMLVNAIADAYLAEQAQARARAADDASAALTARLAAQRDRVQDAENAVQRYRTEHNLVVSTGQVVSEQQLTDVNTQLAAAQNRVSTLKAEIDEIAKQRSGGAPADATNEALQSNVIAKLREQESTLAQRRAYQESQLGPRHPDVATVTLQLHDVRRLINGELDRIAAAAKADYDRAVAHAKALSSKLDGLKEQTLSNDQATVGLRDLQRDLDAVRSVYSSYLLRAQETREQANVDNTNARIITRALPPQRRSWPPLAFILAGALGGGLGLGAGIALVLEYLAPTVLSRGQMEELAGAPVIGTLPPAPALGARRRRWPQLRAFARRRAPAGRGGDTAGASDAVMGLALRRLFGITPGVGGRNGVHSVLLTSSQTDADARRQVARMLAAAAVVRGERVLLIDAGPAAVGPASSRGLMDVLRGECQLNEVLHFEPATTAAGGGSTLAVMGAGRHNVVFQEAVAFSYARRMLAEARHEFDVVIVDGGAVTENVRAFAMVTAMEEVAIVASLNATPQSEVAATAEGLWTMGRRVGSVFLIDPAARA